MTGTRKSNEPAVAPAAAVRPAPARPASAKPDAAKAAPAKPDAVNAAPAKPAPAKPAPAKVAEIGGPAGPEPTRYGDWERKGICVDF